MFMDLDLINKFNIDYLTLCRYHNSFSNPQMLYFCKETIYLDKLTISDGCAQ